MNDAKMFDPKEPEKAPNIPYPGTNLTPEEQNIQRMLSQTPEAAEETTEPENLQDFFTEYGVDLSESDLGNIDDIISDIAMGSPNGELNLPLPGGRSAKSKKEYMDYMKTELEPGDGSTLRDVAGEAAPSILSEMVDWNDGDLETLDDVKSVLQMATPEEKQQVENGVNKIERLVLLSKKYAPESSLATMLDF